MAVAIALAVVIVTEGMGWVFGLILCGLMAVMWFDLYDPQ